MAIPEHLIAEQDNFLEDVRGEDELGVVIRSHIYVESALLSFLESLVVDTKHLEKLGLDYSQRVTLAITLGLKPECGPPLNALGNIRNAFAHQLNTKLTRDRINGFYNQFSSSDKEILNATFRRTSSQVPIGGASRLRSLPPKDQFALFAIALRALLLAALSELHK